MEQGFKSLVSSSSIECVEWVHKYKQKCCRYQYYRELHLLRKDFIIDANEDAIEETKHPHAQQYNPNSVNLNVSHLELWIQLKNVKVVHLVLLENLNTKARSKDKEYH